MINYVFDTNCIVSAHLLPSSVTRKAYDKALKEGILLHSKETLNELAQVFLRPKFDKYIAIGDRLNAISEFEKRSFLTEVTVRILACRDIKDNKFLELAISGNALSIISGDNDLLVLHPFQNISILTPSEFLKNF